MSLKLAETQRTVKNKIQGIYWIRTNETKFKIHTNYLAIAVQKKF